MNCSVCGALVPERATTCASCGRPVTVLPPPSEPGTGASGPSPSTSGPSPKPNPIRQVAAGTVRATKNMAADVKKTGRVAWSEAKVAAHDVGVLTRDAVDEVGKGLESIGRDLQKGKKGN